MEPYVQAAENCVLGETVYWNGIKNELIYVDIKELPPSVHRYNPVTGEHRKVSVEGLGDVSFAIPVDGVDNQYAISTGQTLRLMDWDGFSTVPSNLTEIVTVAENPLNNFNDAKCDSLGRLWAGTVVGGLGIGSAHLYKLERGTISTMVSNINISNGMAWSSDDTLMYYTDTLTRRVDVFDYDVVEGTISNRRPVYNYFTGGDLGSPDGLTIGANGHLFIASFGSGQVIQVDPNTESKVRSISFPTTNVTSPTFGGANLDTLFVATAKSGLPDEVLQRQPTAGSLFQVTNLGVGGQSAGQHYRAG